MGLDTTHDCWHGPYSQFMRWRVWLGEQVGLPLGLMDGFLSHYLDKDELKSVETALPYGHDTIPLEAIVSAREVMRGSMGATPISWGITNGDPLMLVLNHSDCGGKIRWWQCGKIAVRLAQVYRRTTEADDRELLAMRKAFPDKELPPRGCYDGFRAATLRFAVGCLRAYKARQDVKFG